MLLWEGSLQIAKAVFNLSIIHTHFVKECKDDIEVLNRHSVLSFSTDMVFGSNGIILPFQCKVDPDIQILAGRNKNKLATNSCFVDISCRCPFFGVRSHRQVGGK